MGSINCSQPVDALAAFAIAFVSGAMAAIALVKYIEYVSRDPIWMRRCDRA